MTDILNAIVLLGNFVLVPGLAYGSQLALGALGVTLIYGILRFSNLAHGETMSFGAMITILMTWVLQANGISFHPLPTALLALPVGIIGAVALCLIVDRLVYPLLPAAALDFVNLSHCLDRCDADHRWSDPFHHWSG